MTLPYRKKLIEVALPLEAINVASAREKSIRHGHPSTLHLWWARRPLAACRAVLFASLVDDPDSDPQFQRPDGSVDEERAALKRAELFTLIEELVQWENSNNPRVINAARAEIARCVASRKIELGELTQDEIIYDPAFSPPLGNEPQPRTPPLSKGGQGGSGEPVMTRDSQSRVGQKHPGGPLPDRSGTASSGICENSPVARKKPRGRKKSEPAGDETLTNSATGAGTQACTTAWEIVLRRARPEVVNAFLAEHAPPVLDPFCGGGSIPLEAQRLGLRAYASDLNPVPVLITKALIEIPPKFAGHPPVNPDWQKTSANQKAATVWDGAKGLAEDVRHYGKWMRDEAEKRIGHLYPKVKVTAEIAKDRPDLTEYVDDELTVIAWIWARTVASPSPIYQGVHVPLARGYWLSKSTGSSTWVHPVVDRRNRTYRFEVRTGTPTPEEKKIIEAGTKLGRGCKFRCILSDEPIPEAHTKSCIKATPSAARLIAVVADGDRERVYLSADAVSLPNVEIPADLKGIDAPLANDPRNLWCLGYGLDTFDKLFTARQLVGLTTFSDLISEMREVACRSADSVWERNTDGTQETAGADEYADAVAIHLAFALDKCCDYWSTIASWASSGGFIRGTFARQALPMTWDFCECNPFSPATANWLAAVEWVAKAVDERPEPVPPGSALQLDATAAIEGVAGPVISTDPPYYDNISYADLSDFFYIWLRRSLGDIFPQLFATLVTPKRQELIASPYRHDSNDAAKLFFEAGLGNAFQRMREAHTPDFPLTVYYAFKQSETDNGDEELEAASSATASTGWETMLSGLIRSGFSVTGTWPMRTERGARSVGIGTNALASSIVLVCRPRANNAPLSTRKQFLSDLSKELPDALRNLQRGNIAPVDLAQAAIGPGMAVFTRYSKVMESDGTPMSVRTALGLINQSLDEVLAEQEGEFDGDTRWALAWFEQFGMDEGPFGVAEVLSKAKDTAINGLVEAGVIAARAGKVRLVRRDELPHDWHPAADRRLTIWETTQHLIRRLDQQGESGAAALMHQLGGMAEIARDLAYRLYVLCERKKWAEEALAYNGLVIAWPELTKLARAEIGKVKETQRELL